MALTLVQKAFKGIQCGVGVLIFLAGIKMLKKLNKTPYNVISCIVVTVTMMVLSILAIKISTVYVVLIGGALGLILTAINGYKNIKNSHKKSTKINTLDDENANNTPLNDNENGGVSV